MAPKFKIAANDMLQCTHNLIMISHIDKSLLESRKPFNSEHFDTSFDQIDR